MSERYPVKYTRPPTNPTGRRVIEHLTNLTPEEKTERARKGIAAKRKLNPSPVRRKDLVGHRLKIIDETTERIKSALHQEGVTYVELAKRLDMTPGHVSHLMSGTRNMTLATLADIAEAIGYEFTLVPIRKESINGRRNKSFSKDTTRKDTATAE